MAYDVDPCRIFIRMECYRILYDALNSLLGKQAVRIYLHFFVRKTIPRLPEAKA